MGKNDHFVMNRVATGVPPQKQVRQTPTSNIKAASAFVMSSEQIASTDLRSAFSFRSEDSL